MTMITMRTIEPQEKTCEICDEKYAEEYWERYLTEVENEEECVTCCKGECAKAALKRLDEKGLPATKIVAPRH